MEKTHSLHKNKYGGKGSNPSCLCMLATNSKLLFLLNQPQFLLPRKPTEIEGGNQHVKTHLKL